MNYSFQNIMNSGTHETRVTGLGLLFCPVGKYGYFSRIVNKSNKLSISYKKYQYVKHNIVSTMSSIVLLVYSGCLFNTYVKLDYSK